MGFLKSVINVHKISKQKDIAKIHNAIASIEGIIACEISVEKKEIQVIYDGNSVDLDKIIEVIENTGCIVI